MRETSENVDSSAAKQKENWTLRQYFESYIGHDVYKDMAECTNQNVLHCYWALTSTTSTSSE